MRLQIFCIQDEAVGVFHQPMCFRSKGEAVRMFSDATGDEKSQIHEHPQDYVLWHVGEFDDETGILHPFAGNAKVGSGSEFVGGNLPLSVIK